MDFPTLFYARTGASTRSGYESNLATACVGILAAGLLALTLLWHIPMMLWDHLDLVPLYRAWQEGALADSAFWDTHGGHMHAAAYAVLLLTTAVSGGQPWLDCAVSWVLLILYATIVLRLASASVAPGGIRRRWMLGIAFLALFPGHLANLQWGWQIAVFLCLLGVAVAIARLTATKFSWRHNAAALAAAVLAYFSFATGVALIPTAFLLIALRRDLSPVQKIGFMAPWLLLGMLVLLNHASFVAHATSSHSAPQLLHYTLNFLGAGVLRFATDLAPWLALMGVVTGLHAFAAARRAQYGLCWLGFFLFAIVSAVLTALGRVEPFGVDHAFVTRYVSFSSLFWLGWLGLMAIASRIEGDATNRWRMPLGAAVMVFAAANALHMIKQAATVAEETRTIAAQVRKTWPQVDDALLRGIYFDESTLAGERLEVLRTWSFPPFDEAADPGLPARAQ